MSALPTKLELRQVLKKFILGQVIALCFSLTAVSQTSLTNIKFNVSKADSETDFELVKVSLPATSSVLAYSLLLVCNLISLKLAIQNFKFSRFLLFLVLVLCDVCATYLVVKAYDFTSILYIQILDCSIIPIAVVLSKVFLKTRFKWLHYLGAVLCLMGASTLIISGEVYKDVEESEVGDLTSRQLLGNFLVILSSLGYAGSNITQEYIVKKFTNTGTKETRLYFGLLGTPLSLLLSIITKDFFRETEILTQAYHHSDPAIFASICWWLFGFLTAMLITYTIFPLVMKISSAVFINLSTLTADVYAVLIGTLLFGEKLTWLYALGFLLIDGGIVVYNLKSADTVFDAQTLEEVDEEGRRKLTDALESEL